MIVGTIQRITLRTPHDHDRWCATGPVASPSRRSGTRWPSPWQPADGSPERGPASHAQLRERLPGTRRPVGPLPAVGIEIVHRGAHVTGGPPAERVIGQPFAQVELHAQRQPQSYGDDRRCLQGARHRRGHNRRDPSTRQTVSRVTRLLNPENGQRRQVRGSARPASLPDRLVVRPSTVLAGPCAVAGARLPVELSYFAVGSLALPGRVNPDLSHCRIADNWLSEDPRQSFWGRCRIGTTAFVAGVRRRPGRRGEGRNDPIPTT